MTRSDESRLAVFADDGLSFFSSVDAFAGYAEPPDVVDNVYTAAYDALGQRFAVSAPAVWLSPRPYSWRARLRWQRALRRDYFVIVEPDERYPVDPDTAARAIREGLRGRHAIDDLESMSLRDLMVLEPPVL
jgi:hypothetical protein